jgi:hypothetical protein
LADGRAGAVRFDGRTSPLEFGPCARVIDESGEDYVFPASPFQQIAIEESLEKQLLAAWVSERQLPLVVD